MKKFFISFLGAMTAIWLSVLLLTVLSIVVIAALIAAAGSIDSSAEIKISEHSVLRVNLAGEITDRETPVDVMTEVYGGGANTIPLNVLVASIREAAHDSDIEGIMIDCNGALAGLAQCEAIIEALDRFRESGKWIYSYSDNYTQSDYYIASASDSMYVNTSGMVDIHGLSATTMYFKDLLDKLGVNVQVVKVGTYKSAVEPFILNHSSEANREQQSQYLNRIWSTVAGGIARNRNVTEAKVNEWADSFIYTRDADYYVSSGIADRAVYRHQVDELIAARTGQKKPRYIDFDFYAKGRNLSQSSGKSKNHIAVLYAVGDIVDSGDGGIVATRLVPQILEMAENKSIEGLILRVNSGGGSAFASEQIWEALQQFKAISGKPFYVSMGDVAASGGYYISCGADRIYAEPVTLTGSIGIFGLIPDASKLLNDKIGINTSTVATNIGQFPSFIEPMTPGQRNAMQRYVDRGYELFVKRCADGRHMAVDSIKAIAEGRVWDGKTAQEIGLVDRMGSLDEAIADMADELGLSRNVAVREYPKLKFKWWEELLALGKDVNAKIVENELGSALPYYRALKSLDRLDRLQCRMDYVEIQ